MKGLRLTALSAVFASALACGTLAPPGSRRQPADVPTGADAVEAQAADPGQDVPPADLPADVPPQPDVPVDTAGEEATADAADTPDAPDAPPETGPRTMRFVPLFGDTTPENLLLDPGFGVRSGGLGTWQVGVGGMFASDYPSFRTAPMSDSPAGIALGVGRLTEGGGSTISTPLTLVAQVPGGPGPFRLRVWISTLDAAASATAKAYVGLLTGLDAVAIEVFEDPDRSRVVAGRTWHLYEGDVEVDLVLGGFVQLYFPGSQNTWLVQAPEFVPVALLPDGEDAVPPPGRRPALVRAMTEGERRVVADYVRQPRISVPAFHPAIREPEDEP